MSDITGALAQLAEAEADLSTGDARRLEMSIAGGSTVNWDKFIVPAPFSVALLGQLMCLAGSPSANFSMEQNAPIGGFKYIRYPKSFSACMVQLSNDGYNAFLKAHSNMDQIRLTSETLMKDIEEAVDYLLDGERSLIEHNLPLVFKRIEEKTTRCVSLGEQVEKKFIDTMDLIGELLESTKMAQTTYDQKKQETEILLAIKEEQKAAAAESKTKAEEQYKKMEADFQEAKSEYQQALSNVPTGMEMLAMSVAETVTQSATKCLEIAVDNYTNPLKQVAKLSPAFAMSQPQPQGQAPAPQVIIQQSQSEKEEASTPADQPDEGHQKADMIAQTITKLHSLAQSKLAPNETKDIEYAKTLLSSLETTLLQKKANNRASSGIEEALSLCKNAVQVATDLSAAVQNGKGAEAAEMEKYANLLGSSIDGALGLSAKAKSLLKIATNAVSPLLNQIQSDGIQSASQKSGVAEMAMKNSQMKVSAARATLAESKKAMTAAAKEQQEQIKALGDLLGEMAKLKIENAKFEEIKALLGQAMLGLAELREKWGQLVTFFNSIANVIRISMKDGISSFSDFAKTEQQKALTAPGGYTMSKAIQDRLFKQTSDAQSVVFFVNKVANTYYTVSDKYLMPQMASLAKLIALDPAKDIAVINTKRNELNTNCIACQKEIATLVKAEVDAFAQSVENRQKQLNEFMASVKKILPPLPPKQEAEMQKIADDAAASATKQADQVKQARKNKFK